MRFAQRDGDHDFADMETGEVFDTVSPESIDEAFADGTIPEIAVLEAAHEFNNALTLVVGVISDAPLGSLKFGWADFMENYTPCE